MGVSTDGGRVYFAPGEAGLYVFRGCSLFRDGFEGGTTGGWSGDVP